MSAITSSQCAFKSQLLPLFSSNSRQFHLPESMWYQSPIPSSAESSASSSSTDPSYQSHFYLLSNQVQAHTQNDSVTLYDPSRSFEIPASSSHYQQTDYPGQQPSSQVQGWVEDPEPQTQSPTQHPMQDHSRYVSLSCSMVPFPGNEQMPALLNVCVVDYNGNVLCDVLVENIIDVDQGEGVLTYLHEHQATGQGRVRGKSLNEVCQTVRRILEGKIVIGHSLWLVFKLLNIRFSALHTRDHALFIPFQQALYQASESEDVIPLPVLMKAFMRRRIGREGYPLPIEDARASMDLFRACEDFWEGAIEEGSWPCAIPPREYSEYFF